MELTKEQRNFFADLDLDKAIAASEGKVHFDFPHKGRIVEVAVFCSCDADIIVKPKGNAGNASCPDTNLCLLNIPDTTNVSGPEVLRRVHAEACKSEYSTLKKRRGLTLRMSSGGTCMCGGHAPCFRPISKRFSTRLKSPNHQMITASRWRNSSCRATKSTPSPSHNRTAATRQQEA